VLTARQSTAKCHGQPHNLLGHSREISKIHGSLNPSVTVGRTTSSKQYQGGLSMFSPNKVDDADMIYQPTSQEIMNENSRVNGSFKEYC